MRLMDPADGWVKRYDDVGKVPFTHKGNEQDNFPILEQFQSCFRAVSAIYWSIGIF